MRQLLLALFFLPSLLFAQSETLEIRGLVEKPQTLTVESFKKYPVQEGRDFKVVSASGQVRYTLESYRGVRLTDLLDAAVVQLPNQREKGRYFVVATATDGYTAIFSHNDLFNNPTGEGVLVLFQENGKPIPAAQGAFVLISLTDKISGARHVKWLKTIDVRKVEE